MADLKKITDDGSFTLYNEEYKEHYHSLVGAKTEASLKYLNPYLSWISSREKEEITCVFDPFFGLGFNTYAFFEYFLENNLEIKLDAIEIDGALSPHWSLAMKYFPLLSEKYLSFHDLEKESNFSLKIIDLLEGIKNLELNTYDVILHDAFTFHKCPELWTVDLFKHYKKLLKKEGVIVTYSSSKIVRAALIEAGFCLKETEPVGRKRGGTLAIKGTAEKSDIDFIQDYENICSSPYRDIQASSTMNIEERRKIIIRIQCEEQEAKREELKKIALN